jgi:hypothetical protein
MIKLIQDDPAFYTGACGTIQPLNLSAGMILCLNFLSMFLLRCSPNG